MRRAEGNTGEGQTAHSRTTSADKHGPAFSTHARELCANAVKRFPVRERVCPCKGTCYSSPILLLPPPTRPSPSTLSDRRGNKGWREDHISRSQLRAGDLRTWQPAISHEHLPSVSGSNTISSPNSGIDYKVTGVVMAGGDVAACLPTPVCYVCRLRYGCHVCRAISISVAAGQLLHSLLMELLTGNKLKSVEMRY